MTLTYLNKLREVATEVEKQASSRGHSYVFGEGIGIFLFGELVQMGYNSTPLNVWNFAATGGDGVHFSLLEINGRVSDDSPVVMTVPMLDRHEANLVVGEDLLDFLSLGCKTGYFSLEQLIYQRAWELERIESCREFCASGYLEDEDEHALNAIVKEFSLQPWTNIEEKLRRLNEQFSPHFQFSSPESL